MSKTKAINKIKSINGFREIKRREYNGNMETTFVFDLPTANNIEKIIDNINLYNTTCNLITNILKENNVNYKFVNQGMGLLQFASGFGIEYTVDFPMTI